MPRLSHAGSWHRQRSTSACAGQRALSVYQQLITYAVIMLNSFPARVDWPRAGNAMTLNYDGSAALHKRVQRLRRDTLSQ